MYINRGAKARENAGVSRQTRESTKLSGTGGRRSDQVRTNTDNVLSRTEPQGPNPDLPLANTLSELHILPLYTPVDQPMQPTIMLKQCSLTAYSLNVHRLLIMIFQVNVSLELTNNE
ncbi:hypothetical protein KQX54_006911 [Cotesia glomerata]|uniref:Uncharacterized protein n=1 Tax=Cotesia glomerata TaxID=32391 RepID=A0AAV7IFN8_COTGL|nr:hypothetical protein KQX54_006911 [Cotesia glomerata]